MWATKRSPIMSQLYKNKSDSNLLKFLEVLKDFDL